MSTPHAAGIDLSTTRLQILQPEHEAALAEMFVENDLPEITRFFDPFPLDAASARMLCRYEGPDRYWGVFQGDGRLVGLMIVRGLDQPGCEPTLGTLIDRRAVNQGISIAALELVIGELRARGEAVLRAKIHEDNGPCLRGIEKSGWVEVSRGDGRVVMEKSLRA